MDWYYEKAGSRVGPINESQISSLVVSGEIAPETLVWNEKFGAIWRRAHDTELVQATRGSPPPLPTTHVSDFYAWILAFVPAIGFICEKFIMDNLPDIKLSQNNIFMGYALINIIITLLDANKINKSGRNPENITLGRWFWLVPVYLYQRSKTLLQNQKFLLIWIMSFCGSILVASPDILSGGMYFGFGIPSCNSSASVSQVKKIFPDIPIVKIYSLGVVDVTEITELSKDNKTRTCSASVTVSNGNKMNVSYKITERDNDYYYYMSLSQ